MRVLHAIPSLGQGGAERQIALLLPALTNLGIEVHLAYGQGGPNLAYLASSPVHIHQLPARNNHDPRILLDLVSLIRRVRPALVQTWLLQMDVFGGLAARLQGVPHVLSERCSAELYKDGLKMALRRRIGARARAIVANSVGGLDYWRQHRAPTPLHLIRNAVSPLNTTPPADDLGLAGLPLLVSAGRLSEQKNIPVLIDAFVRALDALPAHHAVIFGDGPLRDEAQQRIAASPVADRLHLGGYSDRLGYWLRRADVFVSASHFEGHPNVVIEAACAGCPMVLSDIAAHREIASDTTALFAPEMAVARYAELMLASIANPAAARARAAAALAATADLAVEGAALKYLDVYRQVLP